MPVELAAVGGVTQVADLATADIAHLISTPAQPPSMANGFFDLALVEQLFGILDGG